MSQFSAILILTFFLKLLTIGLGARLIIQKYADLLGSVLGGWLLSQCFYIVWMLFLSAFSELSTLGIWLGIGLLPILFVVFEAKKQPVTIRFSDYKQFLSPSGFTALAGAIIIFFVLTYRSFYFYDNTWDALTYGLTRIAFYAHYHSFLVIQPTQAVNIFSNEWNGELNGLFYLLATANAQAISFGNVEIWLVGFLGFSWFCGLLTVPARLRLLCGLALGSVPALLGLSMTVKGDLLAIVALTISLSYTYRVLVEEPPNPWNFLLALAALGLACGAKVVILPYVSLAVVLLLLNGFFIKKLKGSILIGGIVLFCVGNLRYILNLFAYGDFFKHLETTDFSWLNALKNIKGITMAGTIFPKLFVDYGTLGYGFGFLALPLLCFSLIAFIAKIYFPQSAVKKRCSSSFILLLSLLGINFCFLLFAFPWYPWSFRYFAPILLPGAALLLAWALSHLQPFFSAYRQARQIGFFLMMMLVLANTCAVFLPLGEGYPVPFRVAMQQTEMQRKGAHHPYLWDDLTKIQFEKIHGAKILLLNSVNSLTLPFFGEKHQNHVEFVDSLEQLQEKIQHQEYTMIIISSAFPDNAAKVAIPGYQLKSANHFWMIYLKNKQQKLFNA